jgi:hypothetical protein
MTTTFIPCLISIFREVIDMACYLFAPRAIDLVFAFLFIIVKYGTQKKCSSESISKSGSVGDSMKQIVVVC